MGPFKILRRLANGETGSTFLARTPWLETPWATVKRINGAQAQRAGLSLAARQHGHELLSLLHPSLVSILDLGESHDVLYLAWTHVPGRDLLQVVQRQHRRGLSAPVKVAVAVLLDGLAGLEYLGAQRAGRSSPLLLRWLEPEHLLLGYDGALRVAFAGAAPGGLRPGIQRRAWEVATLGRAVHGLLSTSHPGELLTPRGPLSVLRGDVPAWLSEVVEDMLRPAVEPDPFLARRLRERVRRAALVTGHLGTHRLVGQYLRALFSAEHARERAEAAACTGAASVELFEEEEETSLELDACLVADLAGPSPALEHSLPTIVAFAPICAPEPTVIRRRSRSGRAVAR